MIAAGEVMAELVGCEDSEEREGKGPAAVDALGVAEDPGERKEAVVGGEGRSAAQEVIHEHGAGTDGGEEAEDEEGDGEDGLIQRGMLGHRKRRRIGRGSPDRWRDRGLGCTLSH